MAESLIENAEKYENPVLFVGGSHLEKFSNEEYEKGHAAAMHLSDESVKGSVTQAGNLGVLDFVARANLDFTFVVAGNFEEKSFASLHQSRYRMIFQAQQAANYDQYLSEFMKTFERDEFSGSTNMTVQASPQAADYGHE